MNFDFVLSDETKNSYDSIVKTDGIDTTSFEKNPIMLYMHERKHVVGRWENIRKENGKLIATAIFDDTTELARTVKAQVEKGFLRAASIGCEAIEEKQLKDGTIVFTKTILKEASIVDLPANANAIRLQNKDNKKSLVLAANMVHPGNLDEEVDFRKELIELLEIDENATDAQILDELKSVFYLLKVGESPVDDAVKDGYISENDRENYCKMARIDSDLFQRFINSRKAERETETKKAVSLAVSDGRVKSYQRDLFEQIGVKMGLETLSKLLSYFSKSVRVMEVLDGGDRSNWTLSDYRKYRPNDLKENPALFYKLLAQENETPERITKENVLDYWRKYRAEELKDNPQLYNQLIKQYGTK